MPRTKDTTIRFRAFTYRRKQYEALADKEDIELSEWVRRTCDHAVDSTTKQ